MDLSILLQIHSFLAIHLTCRHRFLSCHSFIPALAFASCIAHFLSSIHCHLIISVATIVVSITVHFFIYWLCTFSSFPAFLSLCISFVEYLITASFICLSNLGSCFLSDEIIWESRLFPFFAYTWPDSSLPLETFFDSCLFVDFPMFVRSLFVGCILDLVFLIYNTKVSQEWDTYPTLKRYQTRHLSHHSWFLCFLRLHL